MLGVRLKQQHNVRINIMSQPQFIKLYNNQPFTKNLSIMESVILSYIIDLSHKQQYCYANNKALADKIGCSEITIKNTIRKLKQEKIIYTKMPNQGRRIYLNEQYKDLLLVSEKQKSNERSKAQKNSHEAKNKKIRWLEQTVSQQVFEIQNAKNEIEKLKAEMDVIKAHITLHGVQIGILERTQ